MSWFKFNNIYFNIARALISDPTGHPWGSFQGSGTISQCFCRRRDFSFLGAEWKMAAHCGSFSGPKNAQTHKHHKHHRSLLPNHVLHALVLKQNTILLEQVANLLFMLLNPAKIGLNRFREFSSLAAQPVLCHRAPLPPAKRGPHLVVFVRRLHPSGLCWYEMEWKQSLEILGAQPGISEIVACLLECSFSHWLNFFNLPEWKNALLAEHDVVHIDASRTDPDGSKWVPNWSISGSHEIQIRCVAKSGKSAKSAKSANCPCKAPSAVDLHCPNNVVSRTILVFSAKAEVLESCTCWCRCSLLFTDPLDSWKMLVAADGKSLIQQTLHLAPTGYKVEYPKPDLLHRGLSFTPSFCRKSWSPNVVPAWLIRFPHGLRCLYPAAGSKWIKWSTQSTSEFWAHGARGSEKALPLATNQKSTFRTHHVPIISLNSTLPVRCSCSWSEIQSATNTIFGLHGWILVHKCWSIIDSG